MRQKSRTQSLKLRIVFLVAALFGVFAMIVYTQSPTFVGALRMLLGETVGISGNQMATTKWMWCPMALTEIKDLQSGKSIVDKEKMTELCTVEMEPIEAAELLKIEFKDQWQAIGENTVRVEVSPTSGDRFRISGLPFRSPKFAQLLKASFN